MSDAAIEEKIDREYFLTDQLAFRHNQAEHGG